MAEPVRETGVHAGAWAAQGPRGVAETQPHPLQVITGDDLGVPAGQGITHSPIDLTARAGGPSVAPPSDDAAGGTRRGRRDAAASLTSSSPALVANSPTPMDLSDSAGGRGSRSFSSVLSERGPSMTDNPSSGVPVGLRSASNTSASGIRPRAGTASLSGRAQADGGGEGGGGREGAPDVHMSEHLAEDDGMGVMRRDMHRIRDLDLTREEKARRMHAIMTADYHRMRGWGRDAKGTESQPGPAEGVVAGLDADAHEFDARVSAEDLRPTYQPTPPETEAQPGGDEAAGGGGGGDGEPQLGCAHYRRNVKVRCGECGRWHTCRHCHDAAEAGHELDRARVRHMLCMLCGHAGSAGEYCRGCGELAASYYCDICKLWDGDASHSIYHCADCGICRRGEGLGRDYIHCKRCNVCISIKYAESHRCVERATECDCPICGEWMFTSARTVVAIRCGHYMHKTCFDDLMQTSFKCPICSRSAINMELQWRKLDHAVEAQPMPAQFTQTQVYVSCNDCLARSLTDFHWLGNKCAMCDSYNTNQIKMMNTPSLAELQELHERRELLTLAAGREGGAAQHGTDLGVLGSAEGVPDVPVGAAAAAGGTTVPEAVDPPRVDARLSPGPHIGGASQRGLPSPIALGSPNYFFPESPRTGDTLGSNAGHRPHSMHSSPPELHAGAAAGSGLLDVGYGEVAAGEDGEEVVAGSPSSWHAPSVRNVSMPSFPMFRDSWSRMPGLSMPRAVSPSAIWAARRPSLGRWSLSGTAFLPRRKGSSRGSDGDARGEEHDESVSGSETDEHASEQDFEDDDGGINEIELFGHR